MSVLVQKLNLSSTGNRATWTFSAWVKRSRQLGGSEFIFSSNTERTGGGQYSSIYFGDDQLRYYDYYSGSSQKYLITNRKFKDVSGWYHIVVRVDTTQATASDRIRFYVNGVQETSFDSSAYPVQNDNSSFVNWAGADNFVGTQTNNLSGAFLGTLSHVHLADGQSYAPTVFGSTDATTGEWKINTSPTVTYGTNGFFLFKNNNVVTDQSGQGNNFSIGSGTLTLSQDNPSSVFATLNPLDVHHADTTTFANANTSITTNNAGARSTIAVESGKFYAEAKIPTNTSWIGVQDQSKNINSNDNSVLLYPAGASMYINGSNQGSGGYGSAWSANDIMIIALDLTSTQKKIYFGKNGGWWNGSDYTANAPSTGVNLSNNITYAIHSKSGSASQTTHWNFGNGYFATTAVSSAGTNASNIGIFEYDVPTGYTALSTKGLNL